MPTCLTKFHGVIEFDPEQVLHIPKGLLGFPQEREFLLLELPSARPLTFLQSVLSSNLCFLAIPAQVIDAGYKLSLEPEDLQALGYSETDPPVMGKDLLCLALLTVGKGKSATANLRAPIVVAIARHQGAQVLLKAPYSHQHPFPAPMAGAKAIC